MTTSKPLWRRGVEAADRVAAPVLEGVSQHEALAIALGLFQQTRKAIRRRTERTSRRFLHALNLPTASDVNRLLSVIAAVENRVRSLDDQVKERLPVETDLEPPAPRSEG
ncbi:hypothetical protein [Trujillonella endophytica]|uniref:Uncharacterized protein n=1 Tax=Trujillonella endophytica TaxID=673521 RepID=A0A1H8QRG9_9ACTN|nr:hypothetical protein [Trujillella endophytica]SEO56434.1 hypothetical protein SAMN05660991_00741 [Trujillella endophytica]